MYKESKAREKQLPLQCFCKENKYTKNTKTFFGERSVFRGFSLFAEDLET